MGAKGRADSPRSDGAVGFFDSGLGGLCILDAFVALCPNESTVYIADSANCPYGNRPADEIVRLSRANTEELLSRGCKMVVVACNTATAAAIDTLRAEWPDVPFIGIEPALKPAALESKTGIVGVLATAGTFGGRLYRETKAKFAKDVTVIATVADEFVEIVESLRVGLGSDRVGAGATRPSLTLNDPKRPCVESNGVVVPCSGASDIFIYPPYRFRVCDCMLTNFHLPQSTLIMMVSALAGRERTLCAYAMAVQKNYMFFSYGDCMLIV